MMATQTYRELHEEVESLASEFRSLVTAAGCKILRTYVATHGCSHYFTVENPAGYELKIRVSDHSDHSDSHSPPDTEMIVGEAYGASEAVFDILNDWK